MLGRLEQWDFLKLSASNYGRTSEEVRAFFVLVEARNIPANIRNAEYVPIIHMERRHAYALQDLLKPRSVCPNNGSRHRCLVFVDKLLIGY